MGMIPQCKKTKILYENSVGTVGNITLSDSITNYSYYEIYFKRGTAETEDTIKGSQKFEAKNSVIHIISPNLAVYDSNKYQFGITFAQYKIKENIITKNIEETVAIRGTNIDSNVSSSVIAITKVIGYK